MGIHLEDQIQGPWKINRGTASVAANWYSHYIENTTLRFAVQTLLTL